MAVNLTADFGSSAPVGTPVVWTAQASGAGAGQILYRFRVRDDGKAAFRIVRDFSPTARFVWAPFASEGSYDMEVTAQSASGGSAQSTATFTITSRVIDGRPVISPTRNPLVYLYSAPSCAPALRTRVAFIAPDGFRQSTHLIDCVEGKTVNVYLAGLRAETDYRVRQVLEAQDGTTSTVAAGTFTSAPADMNPAATRSIARTAGETQPVLLQSKVFDLTSAVDLDGNVIWTYGDPVTYLTRPVAGGYFVALIDDQKGDDYAQIIRMIDLAGNPVFETNAGAVNAQLDRMGLPHITSFHHEARVIPGGRLLVLASSERMLTDVQGPGTVDVIGDTILVLNRQMQVEWVWDAFDHLDPARQALLGETCSPGGGGCPVFRLAPKANDWLHGNALQLTPDGNILYSARHQDWVIKIDYSNGQGSGGIIWRLGKDGDFQFLSDDPWPWFSHQHDPNFVSADTMLVFDNGNTRVFAHDTEHSRGQVLHIDEEARTVSLALNVDLGAYSVALGSAQQLTNGNFHFNVGWLPSTHSQAQEYDSAGHLINEVETDTQQYRSFRMRDLYTP